MRIRLNSFFTKRLEIKVNGQTDSNDPKEEKSDTQIWRNVIAYWLLGLTTEFGYVLIISAAHDILQTFGSDSNHDEPSIETTENVTSMRKSVCDAPSTGVLLLADIVPSMLMNILCPFLPLVKNFRMFVVIALNVTSLLTISSTQADYLAIIGVICTSLSLGIGEVTLLSYSAKFNKKVISSWSSGTGAAGPVGSLLYAGLTLIGISPRDTLRIMLIVPAIQATTFWFLLRSPSQKINDADNCVKNIAIIELNNNALGNVLPDIEVKLSGVKAKLKFIPKLAGFIAPPIIVFIFEYICVSGLFEMIHVQEEWLPPASQYRWYLVMYEVGVFSSRTLGALFKPRQIWWLTIIQAANACGFIYMTASMNMPSAWIIFILVFGMGCVGGFCYVQTFHRIVRELPVSQHKFSLGMIAIAESFGIAVGGLSAIPIRSFICGKSLI